MKNRIVAGGAAFLTLILLVGYAPSGYAQVNRIPPTYVAALNFDGGSSWLSLNMDRHNKVLERSIRAISPTGGAIAHDCAKAFLASPAHQAIVVVPTGSVQSGRNDISIGVDGNPAQIQVLGSIAYVSFIDRPYIEELELPSGREMGRINLGMPARGLLLGGSGSPFLVATDLTSSRVAVINLDRYNHVSWVRLSGLRPGRGPLTSVQLGDTSSVAILAYAARAIEILQVKTHRLDKVIGIPDASGNQAMMMVDVSAHTVAVIDPVKEWIEEVNISTGSHGKPVRLNGFATSAASNPGWNMLFVGIYHSSRSSEAAAVSAFRLGSLRPVGRWPLEGVAALIVEGQSSCTG